MISYALIVLAAFFNACMDCFENSPNFNESIFSHLNKKFWCKDISWEYAKKIGKYKLDSWHISKSLMIFCIVSALWFDRFSSSLWHANTGHQLLNFVLDVIGYGGIWVIIFNLTYHKLFKVK
jgi:hypothetical protein